MLFIVVHQVSELWMRLMLHELTAALECVRRDDLDPALKMLARISRTQTQLISVWDVLSTMTPFEYTAFRNALGRSSGFQSLQYRMLEFLFGNKNAEMLAVHQRDAHAYETLQRALASPSLYDEVLRLLSRRGTRFRRTTCRGISASPTRPANRWPAPGSACTTTRKRAGTCTSSPNAWWTSTTTSSCGAAIT